MDNFRFGVDAGRPAPARLSDQAASGAWCTVYRTIWKRVLGTVGLIVLLTRCGGDSGNPLEPTTYDLAGVWSYAEILGDAALGVSCADAGEILVTQNGPRFTAVGWQEGQCSGPGGIAPFADSFAITQGTVSGSKISFRIDPCPYTGAVYGAAPDSAVGTITCNVSSQGTTLHLTGTWQVRRGGGGGGGGDFSPPTVSGSLSPPGGVDTLVIGDTLVIEAQADDDHALAWLGWRVGNFPPLAKDSIPTSGTHHAATFRRVTVPGWIGTQPVSVFAWDAAGHLTELSIGSIVVKAGASRPTTTFTLPAAVRDLAYDAKRNRVYLSEVNRSEVAVLSLTSAQLESPITLISPGAGLDLSRGGDSLLVALGQSVFLSTVNLVTGQVDTVRLTMGGSQRPDNLRVAADNTVVVTLTFSGSGFGGAVLTYDLATNTQQLRSDVGLNGGLVTERVPLARSGDGQKVLLLIDDSCCPEDAQIYSASNGAFGSRIGAFNGFSPTLSGDSTASRWMMANRLYLGDLTPLLTLTPPGFSVGPTALSLNATVAYLGTDAGYLKVRLSDQSVLETVTLPYTPDRLLPLPGGTTLIATAGTRIMVVDLR
jgi:hypothetical protein